MSHTPPARPPTSSHGKRTRVIRAIARLNIGGPAQHTLLLTQQTRARYPTLLVTGTVGQHEGDLMDIADLDGARVHFIPELGRSVRPWSDLKALWKLWRLCRSLKPEIIHTHTAKAGALGRLAGWLAGVPIRVHTFHGHVFESYFNRVQTGVLLAIEWLLARITTRIIAISGRQASELQRYLGVSPHRICVIPLGLDLERFAIEDTDTVRWNFRTSVAAQDRLVVTMVGRLVPIKNHPLALRALASLPPATRHRILLVLVGGGEEEPRLRELVSELRLNHHVHFAGWRSDLEAVYYGSDIIVLTSDNEGTPVCLIEALACGRPVIATDVGGVADVLDDGRLGRLIPRGDVDALTRALVECADETERARLSANDPAATRTRYGIARLVADIEALYDELLSG